MTSMRVRRMLAGLMAGAMVLGLAGCGSSDSAASTETAVTEAASEAVSEAATEAESAATEAAAESDGSYKGALAGQTLTVGIDVSFVPFTFPDENDEYTGFDVDLLKALSDYLGFDYDLQPMEFTAMLMSVQTNKADVGMAGITMTDEREDVMDFSIPYYDAGIQILVREDSDIDSFDDLGDKKLALKEGTASLTYCEENYPDADIITFATIDEAYLEVSRGAADACVFDAPNMLYYVTQNPDAGCKVVGELQDACTYGILFPAGSENKKYFDAALETFMEDGTYDAIYATWFGANE